MISKMHPRMWLCRPVDHTITARAIVTSGERGAQKKTPKARIVDLRIKLKASESKSCDNLVDMEEHTKARGEETLPIIKRDKNINFFKRLGDINERDQCHHDSIFKTKNSLTAPQIQSDDKVIPHSGESSLENMPKRVLTPVSMRIPEGLEKTIEVFRDLPGQYPFLRSD